MNSFWKDIYYLNEICVKGLRCFRRAFGFETTISIICNILLAIDPNITVEIIFVVRAIGITSSEEDQPMHRMSA